MRPAGAADCPSGSTNKSWAAYVFAVPPPIQGTTSAQGRLLLQLLMRQLLGVSHVNCRYAASKAARPREMAARFMASGLAHCHRR